MIPHGESLEHREIKIAMRIGAKDVSTGIPVGEIVGCLEGCRVKPVIECRIAEHAGADPVRPLAPHADVRIIAGDGGGERKAISQHENALDLPATEDALSEATRAVQES